MPKKANVKKSKAGKQDFRKTGLILFYVGLGAVFISLVINVLFIRPTDFKAQRRTKQYDQCLAQKTDPKICQQNFGN